MKPFGRLALRGTVGILAIVAGALALSYWLTAPPPRRASGRGYSGAPAPGGNVASASGQRAARSEPAGEPVPPYTDTSFDDSGYTYAKTFTSRVADPSSLEQLAASLRDRGHRGIGYLSMQLPRLDAEDPYRSAQLRMLLGALHMYEGEFAEGARWFESARIDDPRVPEPFRVNLHALLGIASLRRGETENCVACRTESSCIFPISPAAVHRKPSGSREAIRQFTAYLDRRPEDIGIRWLLNIAYMTLGEYPDKVPPRHLIPLEPFRSKIDIGRFPEVAGRVGLEVRGANLAGGAIMDDFTNDGLLDIFTSTLDPDRGASLFVNRGDGTFDDRSESAGLGRQIGALNCIHADFDNDGRLDVLLLRGGWETSRRLSLLRNTGDGVFADVTIASGLGEPISTLSGAWGDFDNDGHIDLYVAGQYEPDHPLECDRGRLYRNRGDGTFVNVAAAAGVLNDRTGKGSVWGDYDGDGFPDLYISNLGQDDRLYHNNGDGTFTDVAPRLGVTGPSYSFACWFWDYDNDGRLDIYVNPYRSTLSDIVRSHLGQPAGGERPRLYHNEGTDGFRDVTREAGLDRALMPMGSNFGDLDNDGFLDIYLGTGTPAYSRLVPNVMFKNVDGKRFEDITTSSGTGHLQKGHGVSFGDWDRDGDVDLFIEAGGAAAGDRANNLLFENPGHGNHWLNVRLVGVKTNRAAIGVSIRAEVLLPDGKKAWRHRVIGNGSSFGGNGMTVTIGLGRAEAIPRLEVTWPTSKTRQTFEGVPLDRAIEITEGQADYRTFEWKAIPLRDP